LKTLPVFHFMAYAVVKSVRYPRTPIACFYCPSCGIRFPASARECPKCGDKVESSPDPKRESPLPWWVLSYVFSSASVPGLLVRALRFPGWMRQAGPWFMCHWGDYLECLSTDRHKGFTSFGLPLRTVRFWRPLLWPLLPGWQLWLSGRGSRSRRQPRQRKPISRIPSESSPPPLESLSISS